MNWARFALLGTISLISFGSKTKPPPAAPVETPEAKEGKAIRKIYGTVWIEDPQVIGFKAMGTDPIRTKGSKK